MKKDFLAAGILLSAGESRRMGKPKAFLEAGGRTFFDEAGQALVHAGVKWRVVVASPAVANNLPWARDFSALVVNREPDRGQIHSLRLGLANVRELAPRVSGALLLLVDNQGSLAQRVEAVLKAAEAKPRRVLAAAYQGRAGHPLWLPKSLWDGLIAWNGPDGTRGFLQSIMALPEPVETNADALCDIDTPEEYDRFLKASKGLDDTRNIPLH